MAIRVRCIETQSELQDLAPIWNALLQRSACNCIFLTWEWISEWWKLFGQRYELLVLVAQEDGAITGIAPLMVGRGRGKVGRHFRFLMFIGQNEDVTPEYLDFFIEKGREQAVSSAFCDFLTREKRSAWDVLWMEKVLTSSPNLPLIESQLGRHGVRVARQQEVECPYANLPQSWDAYLKSKSKHFRKRVGYNERRLGREGEIRYLFVDKDVTIDRAFDELVQLNRERWGEGGASFRTDEYNTFHRRLCQVIQPKGWLLLVLQTLGERVISAKYDYCYAGKIWGNQGGWLRDYEKMEVGSVVIGELIRWAIDQGCHEYDFLGGKAEYKSRWSHDVRYMVDLEGYATTLRGRAFGLSEHGKRWIRERIPPDLYKRMTEIKKSLGL